MIAFKGNFFACQKRVDKLMSPVHEITETDKCDLKDMLYTKAVLAHENVNLKKMFTDLSAENTNLLQMNLDLEEKLKDIKIDLECKEDKYRIMKSVFNNDEEKLSNELQITKENLTSVTEKLEELKKICKSEHNNEKRLTEQLRDFKALSTRNARKYGK